MSYNSLRKIMYEIYEITNKKIGIVNEKKNIVAYSGPIEKKEVEKIVDENLNLFLEGKNSLNYTYIDLDLRDEKKNFLFTHEKTEENLKELKLIKILIENSFSKKDDKKNKEEIIEKILKNEIYEAEKEIKNLNINLGEEKIIVLIETDKESKDKVTKILKEFINVEKDFLVELEETKIAILKTSDRNEKTNVKDYVGSIEKKLIQKIEKIKIGVGDFTKNIEEINKSLLEAKIALKIKEIFNKKDNSIYHSDLGIERIIYKLPIFICKKFIKEILKKEKIENLDKDTLFTINKFFENNLNISETSRKLFIHRNTLIYRLEKIKNLTGLDLKIFKDAIKFKLALMIQTYLNFVEKNDVEI